MALQLDQQQTGTSGVYFDFIGEGRYNAQIFRAGISGTLSRVDLWLRKVGSPSDLVVEIRNVSGGEPGVSILASQEVSAASVPTDVSGAELEVTFSTGASITASTDYSIVIHEKAPGVDWTSNYYRWWGQSSNPYANGALYWSVDSGSSWTEYTGAGGVDQYFQTYVETGTQETIQSDAQVSGAPTINSAATIVSKRGSIGILSDAEISPPSPRKTIGSNATIKVEDIQETIDSDADIISNRIGKSILSNAEITIVSDTISETINSDATIRHAAVFDCKLQLDKEHEQTFDTRLKITQPSPTNPTALSTVDLQTGEALELSWTDTGNYGYNVYKDVASSWVLQNSEPLVGSTSYIVGELTTGVSYTFKVVGVNGQGDESSGVTTSGTPTFDLEHYSTKPVWNIYVNGVENTDAILSRVELCYGPSFSTVSFYIAQNPSSVSLNASGQSIIIKVNNRQVFKGYLVKRTDIYSASDLRVEYLAVNTLWDYTQDTVGQNFNEPEGNITKRTTINKILSEADCPTLPVDKNVYGIVNVADNTQLELMSSMARKGGNYKIYCNASGVVSFYKVGSPIYNRTYTIGKHILEERLSTDITDKVGSVDVYSAKKKTTTYQIFYYGSHEPLYTIDENGTRQVNITSSELNQDSDGNLYIDLSVSAENISNVQVFAKINEKPIGQKYSEDLELLPSHVGLEKWPDGSTNGKFAIESYVEYSPSWQPVAASVDYSKYGSLASIKISPVPVAYVPNVAEYVATYTRTGAGGTEEYEVPVFVMHDPYEYLTSILVVYTTEESRQHKSAGGGSGAHRTYHDSVVPISDDGPFWVDYTRPSTNLGNVNNYLQDKADAEYERLSRDDVSGSITVLGDETLDLRTRVNGYEVVRIIHDFSTGFITHIDLTNEQFYRGEASLRNSNNEQTRNVLNYSKETIRIVAEDTTRYKALTGFIKEHRGLPEPKSGISHYSD